MSGEISILGSDMQAALNIVLDFVERHNKQDEDLLVAKAAQELETLITDYA